MGNIRSGYWFWLLLPAVVIGLACFFLFARYRIEKEITVQCAYMGYACGDCTPQYQVRNVLSPPAERLSGKDIDIEFISETQEQAFEQQVGVCAICYVYTLKGDVYYSFRKKRYFIRLSDFRLKLRSKDCCSNRLK
ncbi:MAG: hypothetical protein P0Y53_00395 [Candidatus Pseudobacter hemicellulosilyticus]|uniref:Uncharacterized protein n=1 Tax=Candidatus Pseudobacter hemicellulosilyticus TaxID=3121375 RepID=A0AAJ6BG92_9BACT|nr:MAG: hypothetical protein P0Y53_00395 [Pseudobacter sp.]